MPSYSLPREAPARAAALRSRRNWRRPASRRFKSQQPCRSRKWWARTAPFWVTASCMSSVTLVSLRNKKKSCVGNWCKRRWSHYKPTKSKRRDSAFRTRTGAQMRICRANRCGELLFNPRVFRQPQRASERSFLPLVGYCVSLKLGLHQKGVVTATKTSRLPAGGACGTELARKACAAG